MRKESKFWSTQPVQLKDDYVSKINNESTSTNKENLGDMVWKDVLADDVEMLKQLKRFLDENYVSEENANFVLDYQLDFLKEFISQGEKGWSVLLCNKQIGDVIGSITAIRKDLVVRGKLKRIVEINLLCVRKDCRGKWITEVLVKEITRRVHQSGIYVAIYTSGKELPQKSFTSAKYHHKLLDVKYLNECGYLSIKDANLEKAVALYQHSKNQKPTPPSDSMRILRSMKLEDISTVLQLYEKKNELYQMYELMTKEKLQYFIESQFFECFVIETISKETKERKISGFISLYYLPMISWKVDLKVIKVYNMYYCWGDYQSSMSDLFTFFQKRQTHVINCIEVGHHKEILQQEAFLPGTGQLNYYLYNFDQDALGSEKVNYIVL